MHKQFLGTGGFGNILCINVVIAHLVSCHFSHFTGVPQYDWKILPYRIQRQWKFIAALLSARCTKPSAMGQPRVSCSETTRQASAWCLSVREILRLTPHRSSTEICQLHTYLVPLSVVQHLLSPQTLTLDKVVLDAMTNVIVLWFVKKQHPQVPCVVFRATAKGHV